MTNIKTNKTSFFLKITPENGSFYYLDIHQFSINYSLMHGGTGNTPVAYFDVSVGKVVNRFSTTNTQYLHKEEDVYKALNNINRNTKIECVAQIDGYIPGKERVTNTKPIWVGYGLDGGTAVKRSMGGISVRVFSEHWLSKFNQGSVFFSSITVSNVFDYFYDIVGQYRSLTNLLGSNESRLSSDIQGEFLNKDFDIIKDIVKTIFERLDPSGTGDSVVTGTNALDRFISSINESKCNTNGGSLSVSKDDVFSNKLFVEALKDESKYSLNPPKNEFNSVKLSVKNHFTTEVKKEIIDNICQVFLDKNASQSMLDKFFILSNIFNIGIVPGVECAVIAPTNIILDKSKIWRTIKETSIIKIEYLSLSAESLSGMALLADDVNLLRTFNPLDQQNTSVRDTVAATFMVEDGSNKITVMNAPALLNRKNLIETTNTEKPEENEVQSPDNDALTAYDILACNYAKMYFNNKNFASNEISISVEPLRLDIAPGSFVKVETQYGDFYGTVSSVSLAGSSTGEHYTLTTSLKLNNIVNDKLIDEVGFVDGHPVLGDNVYIGNPLIKINNEDISPR